MNVEESASWNGTNVDVSAEFNPESQSVLQVTANMTIIDGVANVTLLNLFGAFGETYTLIFSVDSLEPARVNVSINPCPANTTAQTSPTYQCVCSLGFQYNNTRSSCDECPVNTFKNFVGNGVCSSCVSGEVANPGSSTCVCANRNSSSSSSDFRILSSHRFRSL